MIPVAVPEPLPAVLPAFGGLANDRMIRIGGLSPADGETITVTTELGSTVYECDVDELGVAPGHVAITSTDWSAGICIAEGVMLALSGGPQATQFTAVQDGFDVDLTVLTCSVLTLATTDGATFMLL